MGESSGSGGEALVSIVIAVAVIAFLVWKKRRQFGHSIYLARVFVNETLLRCHVCQGEAFRKREGLVNTTWMTLLKLDPLNESAHCLTCQRCGYAHWFMSRHELGSGLEHPNTWIRYEIAPPSKREP